MEKEKYSLPNNTIRRMAYSHVADHPDQENYVGQKIYFVIVEEYIYLVPHIVEKDHIFLKTIIPSRKKTRAYKKEQEA